MRQIKQKSCKVPVHGKDAEGVCMFVFDCNQVLLHGGLSIKYVMRMGNSRNRDKGPSTLDICLIT